MVQQGKLALHFGRSCALAVAVLCVTSSLSSEEIAIIDAHAHIVRGVQRGGPSPTASQALDAMNAFQVEKTILLPPPFPPEHPFTYGLRELEPLARANPSRFAFAAGGESLNPMIQRIAPENVTPEVIREFEQEAESIAQSGAAGFGEFTAEHFSFGRNHPYESAPPDHPLFLALADIAARHGMPIDLHMEALPTNMAIPERLAGGANPDNLKENISGFERLLAHNPNARIVWAHAGWDHTGERTVSLMRSLLGKHPNLYMSIKLDTKSAPRTYPFSPFGQLKSEWLDLLRDFPDRFMVGSDQFFDAGTERLDLVRKFIDALPQDLARKIARENALRIYRLSR